MAWYRAGVGGIPSSLKTGMDSVLNKKFGTSTTYPAEGWPDTVNLMGPLPEKTVSGSIAKFADGADAVPLKKCEITLPASLDGYTEVDVVHSGKNLLDYSSMVYGYVQANGQFAPYHTQGEMRSGFIPVKPNTTYHLALETEGTAPAWVGIGHYSDSNVESFIERTGYWNFTTGANTHYVVVSARNFAEATNCQLELGSVTTAFEPYSPIDTHTATLGRTIYGGTVDIVNGQGSGEYGNIDMGTLTWQYDSANTRFFTVGLTGVIKRGTSGWITDLAVDSPYTVESGTANDKAISEYASTGYVYIKDTDYTDPSTFKASLNGKYLTYPLATPTDFTFDPVPIDSKLGNNTIWSEQGSSAEVTYRADMNLALGGQ